MCLGIREDLSLRSVNSAVAGLAKTSVPIAWTGVVPSISPRSPEPGQLCRRGCGQLWEGPLLLHIHPLSGVLGGSSWLTQPLCTPSIFLMRMETRRVWSVPFTSYEVRECRSHPLPTSKLFLFLEHPLRGRTKGEPPWRLSARSGITCSTCHPRIPA